MDPQKHYLSQNQIDDCCIYLRDRIAEQYPYYAAHVNFLYNYGCRVGELFDYRISFDGAAGEVIILPQKKNNPRTLPMINASIPQIIQDIQITQENTYLNKRNLQRIIERENPYRVLKCGNKKIGAHLFRHNWIKKQIAAGYQISSIDQMLGYTTQTIADSYAVSKIYYES